MNKASEIISAWWIAKNPTPEQSEMAKKRLEVLKTCNCEEYKELKEKIEKYK